MTKKIRSHTTWAVIGPAPGSRAGVLEVRITGPFTRAAFMDLRPQVFRETIRAPAVVVRLDTSTDMIFSPPELGADNYPPGLPPQAVVVAPVNLEAWLTYTGNLTRVGLIRAVFPTEQAGLAYRWAEQAARLRLGQDRRQTRPRASSGSAPLE
jgi:hypothetical protein